MLDVHVPHGSTHGWRDFLVHIAAISIGLVLALALEQLAAYFHERGQLTAARQELALELAENRQRFEGNIAESIRIQHELDADLGVIEALRAHTVVDHGKFDYSVSFFAVSDGPWQAVRQNGSLALMPFEELETYAWF
jgi:hypothetical protein